MRDPAPRCPSCHEVLHVPARYCYACGMWLQTMANDATLPPPPASGGPVRPCPRCSYPAVLHGNFCANCDLRLNEEPLTRGEVRTRKWQAEEARQPMRSQTERDRSTVRSGWIAIVVCTVLLVADIILLVRSPGHAAFLGPIAALLVLHAPVWLSVFNDARRRQRGRRKAPTSAAPPTAGSPPAPSASSGHR